MIEERTHASQKFYTMSFEFENWIIENAYWILSHDLRISMN